MTAIDIRPCTPADIDAVIALDREWEEEGIAHVFEPLGRADYLDNLAAFAPYFWVAVADRRVVGYINGSAHTGTYTTIIPPDEPYVVIENLYVTSERRHQRIGGQLIERLMDSARQHGIQRFVVGSNSRQMDKILAFYQEHGFQLWHVQLYR